MNEDLDAQFKECERELAMRRRMYPRWIAAGTLPQAQADRQIALMEGIKETVRKARMAKMMGSIRE